MTSASAQRAIGLLVEIESTLRDLPPSPARGRALGCVAALLAQVQEAMASAERAAYARGEARP